MLYSAARVKKKLGSEYNMTRELAWAALFQNFHILRRMGGEKRRVYIYIYIYAGMR